MCVLLKEESEVPSRGRFGGQMSGRTVVDMNTITTLMSVVGSHEEHHGFWFPFAFLWLALIGVGIWFLARGRRPSPPSGLERAREIVAERYARGELTGDEYRERLEQLK